jgi:outer membrane protein TolC
MVSLEVRVDLPIFEGRRQGPGIAAKLAAAERVRAEAEDAKRAHLAEVKMTLAEWQASVERVQRFDSAQLPLALERRDAALASYAGGRGDLLPVVEARRMEIETRLGRNAALADAARAWAQLNFILPETEAEVHP